MAKRTTTLRDLISDRGQTVSEFCREHGFARNTAQQWVSGDRRPYDVNLRRLAEAIGVDLPEIERALEATAAARAAGKATRKRGS